MAPAEFSADMAPGGNVTASFTEAMRKGSISTKTVKLYEKGADRSLPATVTYDAVARRGILNPDANLRAGATYKAVVTAGAKDLAGNGLDQNPSATGNQPKVWFFTVRN